MKKNKFIVIMFLTLLSCKKEDQIVTNSISNSATCVENTKINFTSTVAPISRFAECIKDVDGNVYKTFVLKNQQWMAENLKVSKYNDGTPIPNIIDNSQWYNLKSSGWCYYNNDTINNAVYGKLYNWSVVNPTLNGNKNICPQGWHVPSYLDWIQLIDNIGSDKYPVSSMKEAGSRNWSVLKNTNSTNSSLFTSVPSGARDKLGKFFNLNAKADYWTSNEYDSTTVKIIRISTYNSFETFVGLSDKFFGYSIRCVRD